MAESTDITIADGPGGNLHEMPMVIELGESFGMPTKSLISFLRTQIVKVPQGQPPATPAELLYAMSVMRKYRLDPTLKQIHAWRDKRGDLAVMVGYDGWIQYAREQPGYLRTDYEYGDIVATPDSKGKRCWEWVKATVIDAGRGAIQTPPVFLDEWYQPQPGQYPGPWQKQTRHKLHVVAFRLAIREAYGLGGIDVRDPEDFQSGGYARAEATMVESVDDMAARLEAAKVSPAAEAIAGGCPDLAMGGLKRAHESEDDDTEALYADAEEFASSPESDPPNPPMPPGAKPLFDAQAGCCFAVGCEKAWSSRCATCGERFCSDHMGENRMKCLVCGGGE